MANKMVPNPANLLPVSFGGDWGKAKETIDKNWATIEAWDKEARANKTLIGRTVCESYADGAAVYVVTKENKTTLQITVCQGIGDDWVIPYWGEKTNVKKSYLLPRLERGFVHEKQSS